MNRTLNLLSASAFATLLSACGGGGDDSAPAAPAPAVNAAPSITTGPTTQTVTTGSTATFNVVATGNGSLGYQWQRNGSNIAGATGASYTTGALDATASGATFRVVVSNAAGSTTSAAATLTVAAAALGDNVSTANTLANEAYDAIAAAERKSQLPGGVELFGLPAGVSTTVACTGGGSYTYDFPTTFTAGTRYSFTYNNCQFITGYFYNGSYTIDYSSFANATNFSWTATYDLRLTGPNNFSYGYAGSQTCSYVNSVASCTYNDGIRTFSSNFSYTGGRISGSYSSAYNSNVTLTYNFSNWTANSGSLSVTGSNGFTATVTRTAINTFSVTINGGTPYVVTITR